MNAHAKNSSVWIDTGDDVLSICLYDDSAWETAHLKLGLMPAHFATIEQREIFNAILTLRKDEKPLVDNLIRNLCGSGVTVEKIGLLVAMYDEYRRQAFMDNVKLVRNNGLSNKASDFLKLASEKIKVGDWKATADTVIKTLTSLGQVTDIGDVTAKAHAIEFDAILDNPPQESIRTYVPFFDECLYGIARGKLMGIVAPYKSRKTTVALNLIVGAIMGAYLTGAKIPSIGFMSGEMLPHEVSGNFIAMIAVGLLAKRGLYERADERGFAHNILSGEMLTRYGSNYRKWQADKVKAIDDARYLYREAFASHLRIYDKLPIHGGISTIEKLESSIRRDLAIHQTELFIVDYAQVFSTSQQNDGDYERLRVASGLFQDVVKSTGVSLIALGQMNEAGIKDGAGYSANVKGGGALSQAVDSLLQVAYKTQEMPLNTQMRLTVKLGRSIDNSERIVQINPSSGLILDNTWIQHLPSEVF